METKDGLILGRLSSLLELLRAWFPWIPPAAGPAKPIHGVMEMVQAEPSCGGIPSPLTRCKCIFGTFLHKKAGKVVPHPFPHWDMWENSLPYPLPGFHEVCGNFRSLQPHSLSSILLKFSDWHRNYKGGTDRTAGRETQSLGAFNSLETNLKGKNQTGFMSL